MDGNAVKNFGSDAIFSASGVFTLVFLYALAAGLLVQLVILPVAMPALDAGDGLLKGGDWVWFQQEAVQLAARIRKEGWTAWELRPQDNAPVGIAGAAYALSGTDKPWVLLPLNAALFAVGAASFYMMFALVAPNRLAFAATMPYVLFPSAALIFGQIHKDVWSVAGVALVALVWVRFAANGRLGWKDAGIQVVLALAGVLLVWLVRPYLIEVVVATSLVALFVISVSTLATGEGANHTFQWWAGAVLTIVLILSFMEFSPRAEVSEGMPSNESAVAGPVSWHRTEVIPVPVDNALSKLAERRQGFSEGYLDAGSTIDRDVQFHSASDVARYAPRAAQIALLAPFPAVWRGTGVSPGADHMRSLAGVEMAFTYLLLPGVILVFVRRGFHGPTVVTLIQAAVPIVILALVVSNVGTLYRMRYAYLQLFNGLGVIGWIMWFQHWKAWTRGAAD